MNANLQELTDQVCLRHVMLEYRHRQEVDMKQAEEMYLWYYETTIVALALGVKACTTDDTPDFEWQRFSNPSNDRDGDRAADPNLDEECWEVYLKALASRSNTLTKSPTGPILLGLPEGQSFFFGEA
jgi:hypothetical protein